LEAKNPNNIVQALARVKGPMANGRGHVGESLMTQARKKRELSGTRLRL
jgi:hypothetical protein